MSPRRSRRLLACAPTLGAAAVLALLVATSVGADLLAPPPDPVTCEPLLAVLVHGARATIAIGAIASLLSLLGGVVFGTAAGLAGGPWDRILTRVAELLSAFPTVVMVGVVCAVVRDPGLATLGAAIGLVRFAEVAKLVRVELVAWQSTELAVAARATGATAAATLVRHVMPRVAPVLAQTVVSTVSAVVVIQTLIGFLGLAPVRGVPSWGGALAHALSEGRNATAVVMVAACVTTVAAVQILAERVREWLDPYAKHATPCIRRS